MAINCIPNDSYFVFTLGNDKSISSKNFDFYLDELRLKGPIRVSQEYLNQNDVTPDCPECGSDDNIHCYIDCIYCFNCKKKVGLGPKFKTKCRIEASLEDEPESQSTKI